MTFAVVRFTSEGFHRWPSASGKRVYLANFHRHLFYVEVKVQVFHNDREIEFQDLRDYCIEVFPTGNLGSSSCEELASDLRLDILSRFGNNREVRVSVFEDNEMGAEVC